MTGSVWIDAARSASGPLAGELEADVVVVGAGITGAVFEALLGGRDDAPLEEVAAVDGRVVHVDGEHRAVHRTDDGRLVVLSAVCPHLKCLVQWNPSAHTWDCPCHGSRFDVEGQVIEGPALEGLALAGPRK